MNKLKPSYNFASDKDDFLIIHLLRWMKKGNEIGEEKRRSVAVSYIESYLGRSYCKSCGALMRDGSPTRHDSSGQLTTTDRPLTLPLAKKSQLYYTWFIVLYVTNRGVCSLAWSINAQRFGLLKRRTWVISITNHTTVPYFKTDEYNPYNIINACKVYRHIVFVSHQMYLLSWQVLKSCWVEWLGLASLSEPTSAEK